MNLEDRYKDPLICSFINLLGIINEKNAREGVYKFVEHTLSKNGQVMKNKAKYYTSCCIDEKSHLVNVLNHCLRINLSKQKSTKLNTDHGMKDLYYQIIQKNNMQKPANSNLLQTYYMLVYLMSVDRRYELLELINAQISCMVKIQNYVKLLWRKSRIPFEMTSQFMIRFTEGQNVEDPYDFLNWETDDKRTEEIFKDLTNDECDKDQLFWKSDGGVETRRKRSDNPLL